MGLLSLNQFYVLCHFRDKLRRGPRSQEVGERGRLYLKQRCYHQNDIGIKVGSLWAHLMFNTELCKAKSLTVSSGIIVSLLTVATSTIRKKKKKKIETVSTNHTLCTERWAKAESRTEVRPLTSLAFYH